MSEKTDSTNSLKPFNELTPLDESDRICMDELREVLRRHNKLDRLGVMLLHQHFDVKVDEVLVEASEPRTRTLKSVVVKRSELPPDVIDTSWSLSSGVPVALGKCRDAWHNVK
jgi:hypothetical protein